MAHDLVRVLDGAIHYLSTTDEGSGRRRFFDNLIHKPFAFDTGLTISGAIKENGAPASNTRVALIHARTLLTADVLGCVPGNAYLFRSVAASPDGYFVMGVDLDGDFQPIVQGPIFPVAP